MTQKGAILVEVLIAVSICIVGLLALVQIGTKAVNNSSFAAREAQATTYAATSLEVVRQQKNTQGWSAFKASHAGGIYCGQNLNPGACGISGTPFTSSVQLNYITTSGVETMEALSVVSWEEGNGQGVSRTAKVQQVTVFTRY